MGKADKHPNNIILKNAELVNNALFENAAKIVKSFMSLRPIPHQSAQKSRESRLPQALPSSRLPRICKAAGKICRTG